MIWLQLKNASVRDLAWCCFSEQLFDIETLAQHTADTTTITAFKPLLTTERQQWLHTLDSNPLPLLSYLGSDKHHYTPRRLGLYFEKLWQFFLEEDKQFTLVAHNLPVRDEGRTLGEFDLIYYCHQQQQHFHLELALKYYLGVPLRDEKPHSDYTQWIGPNCEDRLDLKLERLFNHQIRLSEGNVARQVLGQFDIKNIKPQILLKGLLFNSATEPLNPLPQLQTEAQLGTWYSLPLFIDCLKTDHVSSWLLLEKQHWIANYLQLPTLSADLLEDALTTHFSQSMRPLMVIRQDSEQHPQQRLFITPEHWPYSAYPKTKYKLGNR